MSKSDIHSFQTMSASKPISLLKSFFLLLCLSLLSSPSVADPNLRTPQPPKTICQSTTSPAFCKSFLPNSPATVHSHCRFTLNRALTRAQAFLTLLQTQLKLRHLLPLPAITALNDCNSLASRNLDFILDTFGTVNKTSDILNFYDADSMQALISALITNQDTCYDAMKDSSVLGLLDAVAAALLYDRDVYSLYLSLFTLGWVPKNMKAPGLPGSRHFDHFRRGQLRLKMSPKDRGYYEAVRNRKPRSNSRRLLQTNEEEGILVNGIVVVSQNGGYDYTTINAAVAAAPDKSAASDGYFLIFITAGVYNETVLIPKTKKYVLMIGEGNNGTVITGNQNVVDGSTTFNSATVAVEGTGFFGVNLTITNTAGAIKQQAVALRVSADETTFYSCIFEGYQDTLYTHSLRQFYRECDVYGTVDFIFGNAAVVLQNCNLYARLPLSGQFNALTAQGRTDPNQNTGTSIHNCTLKPTPELAASPTTKSYLGRPWKTYARTVYMQSFIDSFINPAGWREWDGTLNLNTSYYAEYDNRGPGSNTDQRVKWAVGVINATDASMFTVSNFLAGDQWLPRTTVPYTGALI